MEKQATYDVVAPVTHEGWLEERNKGIGSSEIAAIMGASRFQTAYDVWERKTGQAAQERETPIMTMGHLLEPYVAELFASETGAEIDGASGGDWIARLKRKPYMQASPDRIFHLDGEEGILECKTTAVQVDGEKLPEAWVMQLTWQMGITSIHQGALAWLNRTSGKFGYRFVDFDERLFDRMEIAASNFWFDHVEERVPPEPQTEEELQKAYPQAADGKQAVADKDIEDAVERLKYARDMQEYYGTQAEEQAGKIKAFMRDAETLAGADGTTLATWKTRKGADRFDAKRFKAEHPDTYGQYVTKAADTRTFLIK